MQPRIGYHHKPSCSRPRPSRYSVPDQLKSNLSYIQDSFARNNRQSEHQTRSNQPVLYQRQQQGSAVFKHFWQSYVINFANGGYIIKIKPIAMGRLTVPHSFDLSLPILQEIPRQIATPSPMAIKSIR